VLDEGQPTRDGPLSVNDLVALDLVLLQAVKDVDQAKAAAEEPGLGASKLLDVAWGLSMARVAVLPAKGETPGRSGAYPSIVHLDTQRLKHILRPF
jgi:hypothetical protein